MVVSDDKENNLLKYHEGMKFNKDVGYPIPNREIVSDFDHHEITSSIYGMTWNPALMHYYPTTPFNVQAYSSAEGIGDSGMDIIGGLKIEDFANLTNESEDAEELISFVQELYEEEFDNVEGELDLIEQSELQLSGFVDFEGEEAKSGRNLTCRTGCATKHPFNKTKRVQCEEECDKIFKPSQKQDKRRQDRKDRIDARDDFRKDKRSCKDKKRKGELTESQYKECIRKERKQKRSQIKEAGGNLAGRTWRATAKVFPLTLAGRGGALILVEQNVWGFSTRLAPALLPDSEAKDLFKPEAIEKAKKGWKNVSNAWKNLGGDPDKLKSSILKGYRKKPYKVSKKSSFDGEITYEFEEQSNFVDPATLSTAISTGITTLGGLANSLSKSDVEKNPYKDDKTPEDYKKSLEDGSVVANPESDGKTPIVNEKGQWIEPSTGKEIDPITGKYKDNIFGMNKWLVVGIGVVGLVAVYYLLKGKK
jgi:hypothetical protein